MATTRMVVKAMHKKIWEKVLLVSVTMFIFSGFSSFVFANTYGSGTYGYSEYSTANLNETTSGSSIIYGCKDPTALNYSYFVSHDQSLCKYENITTSSTPTPTPTPTLTRTLKDGMTGDDVKELQVYLNTHGYDSGTADGKFGPKTKASVILFQKANNLIPDGIVGPLTREKMNQPQTLASPTTLNIARTLKLSTPRMIGDDVLALQNYLSTNGYDCGTADGKFGPKTKASVILFQKANGLTPDGIVGPLTKSKLK